ncbi:MAG: hypothetical protein RIC80_23265 [Cyclobacteriaceae bacterium]
MEEQEEENIETFQQKFENFIETAKGEISLLKSELNDITDLYNDFVKKPSTAVLSKAEKLNETFEKVNEYSSEIAEVEDNVKEFETKIFGKTTDDKDSLKFKLNSLKSEHEKLHEEWEEKFETLSIKIEGLLPGATSTGLAKSYFDQKNSYRWPNFIWSSVFTITMVGMVYYAIQTVSASQDIGSAFMNILSRAPFFIPTIWLALFASKQQSQNRRLEQEYAFKESLSKSYDGYKREIEKLPQSAEKDEIMEKLVRTMVDTAGFNPSSTLERASHNDKPPLFASLFGRKGEDKK